MIFNKTTFLAIGIMISLALPFSAFSAEEEVYLQQGHAKLHAGKLDEAIVLYQKSLSVNPNFKPAQLSLANALQRKISIQFATDYLPVECRKGVEGAEDAEEHPTFAENLSCAKKYFTIDGKPINPRIIEEMITWISDSGNLVTAINLQDAQDSNRFFTSDRKITAKRDGKFFTVISEKQPNDTDDCDNSDTDAKIFTYKVEGVTQNGVFVVSTDDNSGGSMDDDTLAFFKIDQTKSLTSNKLAADLISIIKLGEFPGTPSNIKINGNIVSWKSSDEDQTEQTVNTSE